MSILLIRLLHRSNLKINIMKKVFIILLCLLSLPSLFGQSNEKKEEIAKAIIQGVFDDVWGEPILCQWMVDMGFEIAIEDDVNSG